jgi:putative redox protein
MASIKEVTLTARSLGGYKIEARARDHVSYVDQPKPAGGTDSGPTPLEYLFVSLAGCIITIGKIIAHQRKLELRDIRVDVSGKLDLDVLMGKNSESRAGFTGITVRVDIDADMTREEKVALLEEIDRRCPISDNIAHVTRIDLEVV